VGLAKKRLCGPLAFFVAISLLPSPGAFGAESPPKTPSKATDGLPGDPSKLVKTFKKGRSGLTLRFSGIESSLATMSAFVMPGETLEIEAKGGSGLYAASSRTGTLVADEKKPKWTWAAPSTHGGDHEIRIRDRSPGKKDAAMLRVFVLRPYDGAETIDEYPIGQYQAPPAKNSEAFAPPRGFVEVTDDNVDVAVSPHFKLSQFVCKDGIEGTRYLALDPALLVKLEKVLEALASRGLPATTLQIFSGFRTPAYNARIGNETGLSRHLYGDAADVVLDRDGDGEMDDLDGDGIITKMDASVLHNLIHEALDSKAATGPLAGGLATYDGNLSHGPFVHIDTRGVRVRW
jgi:hypothetical protein